MKILFTGVSSFTGFHFVNQLAQNKQFEIHAILSNKIDDYTGLKKQRISLINSNVIIHENIQFGDDTFLELVKKSSINFDALCCHGAFVENYNSPEFDICKALSLNARNISQVLRYFKEGGGKILVHTGSIFEPNEGVCDQNANAFNPYGLSKHFTNQLLEYHSYRYDLSFGKFVIPNPFGKHEEPRFTNYLFNCWFKNETPLVKTPKYIRDNIPIDLLAVSYVDFVKKIMSTHQINEISQNHKINPSGYVESQGQFTERIVKRLNVKYNMQLAVNFHDQVDFDQPISRFNQTNLFELYPGWNENSFWDDYLDFYMNKEILVR
jgi:UDP-glucose 4-epimerase